MHFPAASGEGGLLAQRAHRAAVWPEPTSPLPRDLFILGEAGWRRGVPGLLPSPKGATKVALNHLASPRAKMLATKLITSLAHTSQ